MIDIVDIKGKKFIFIDELSSHPPPHLAFAHYYEREFQNNDVHPGFQIDCSFYKKLGKLGERIAY
jgi:hypothetical protein